MVFVGKISVLVFISFFSRAPRAPCHAEDSFFTPLMTVLHDTKKWVQKIHMGTFTNSDVQLANDAPDMFPSQVTQSGPRI